MNKYSDKPTGTDRAVSWLLSSARKSMESVQHAVGDVARQEISQVREQAAEKYLPVARDAAIVAGGGAVAAAGGVYLVHGAVLGLSKVMPRWAATMVVGGALATGGGTLIRSGRERLSKSLEAAQRGDAQGSGTGTTAIQTVDRPGTPRAR